MVQFLVRNRGSVVATGFRTQREANSFRVNFIKQRPGQRPSIERIPDPAPIPPSGGFQIFTVDKGGGRTPQTTSPFKTFGTRLEAQQFLEANRRSIADRETPVGIRATPTAAQEAAFKRTKSGAQITGPPPKGKVTTRTAAEQLRIQQKAATLALKNIREGRSVASKATIARLKAQEKTQKQFVEARTIEQLRKGTALTQFKTFADIRTERTAAVVQRARETKKQQLRKVGGELIFKPSIEFFERVPGAVAKKRKLPIESELIQELRAQKGFVTFKAPTKPKEIERVKQISVFRPTEIFKVKPVELRRENGTSRIDRDIVRSDDGIFNNLQKFFVGDKKDKDQISGLEKIKRGIESRFEQQKKEARTLQQFAEQEKLRGELKPFSPGRKAQTLSGLIFFGTTVTGAVVSPFIRPVETGKGVVRFGVDIGKSVIARRPVGSVQQLITEFQFEPIGTIGELFGVSKGIGIIAKGAKVAAAPVVRKIPKPRAEVIKIPIKGQKRPTRVLSVGLEREGRALTLLELGKPTTKTPFEIVDIRGTKGVIELVTPIKLKLSELKGPVAIPRTATATKTIQDVFELTPKERARITSVADITRVLRTERGKPVTEAFFDLESFRKPKKASKILEITSAKEGGVVFGTATFQQLPKGFRLRPGDVDVFFPRKTEAQLKPVVKRTAERLQAIGEKVRLKKDNPLIVETLEGKTVFEAKAGRGPIKFSGDLSGRGGLGFDFPVITSVRSRAVVPFGRTKATRAGEQLQRTGVASLFFRPVTTAETPLPFQVAGVFPKGKRTKDVVSFVASSVGLTELVGASLRFRQARKAARARKATKSFFETFTLEQQKFIQQSLKERGAFKIELGIPKQPKPKVSPTFGTGVVGPITFPSVSVRTISLRPGRSGVSARPGTLISTAPIIASVFGTPAVSTKLLTPVSPRARVSPRPRVSPIGRISPGRKVSPRPEVSPLPSPFATSITPITSGSLFGSPSPSPTPSPSPSPSPSILEGGTPSSLLSVPPSPGRQRKAKPGFDTFLRRGLKRGSKFDKISENKPKNLAVRVGARAADSFIEATFLIKPSGRKATRKDIPQPNLKKFRGTKKGSVLPFNSIIERRKFRLDQFTETRQISFFRERALRNRIRGQIRTAAQRKQIKQSGGFVAPVVRKKRLRFL